MDTVSKDGVLKALGNVKDPDTGQDIVTTGMVSGLEIGTDGAIVFMLEVDPRRGPGLESLRQEAECAVAQLPGVQKVTAVLTAERQSAVPDPHGMNKNPHLDLPIRYIIAVASGKGGVGKSTVAANLAVSLAKNGQKIGLLDADIYGPSQPLMMGLQGQKPDQVEGKIQPLQAHGVKVMSIGFMIDGEAPLIWRGPMVQTAIYQLLRDVAWGSAEEKLDVLVVDMPPGTGDAQLTMAQKVPLAGAVIVSTPQDIALIDARKAVTMFEKVNVPILGLVENMSHYSCPSCGHEDHIFGHGGAREETKKLGCDFLGEIPLNSDIRLRSDEGTPLTAAGFESPSASVFQDMAQKISGKLSKNTQQAA